MAAQKQTDLNKSLYKYLYDNLNSSGVKVFESIFLQDFDSFTKWVVIDCLSNRLSATPMQLYFIHAAVHKKDADAHKELDSLIDVLITLFEEGQKIDIYSYPSGVLTGYSRVTNPDLSPLLEHKGGGLKRSLTFGLYYIGN